MSESGGATGAPPPSIKVEPGQSLKDQKIKLAPLGVIAGRVLDEDGDPVRGALVQAMEYSYAGGKRQLRGVDQVGTNDKGEFRLFGLHPGTFYLHASDRHFGNRGMSFMSGGGSRITVGNRYGETYYPGTTDAAHAAPIELAAGAELRGFDFRLRQEPRYSIRGKLPGPLRNDNDGNPRQNYSLQLQSRSGGINRGFSLTMDNENFEFTDVVPGSYVVMCMPINGEKGLFARQAVEVVSADVEGVTFTFMPLVDVSGTVRVEGTPSRPVENLRVTLHGDTPVFGHNAGEEVKPDGSFLIAAVPADVYEVKVQSTQGTYLKSIRFGDAEAPDNRIDLTKGSGPVTVVLGTDVGEVEGSVKKANGDVGARVRVTLVAYGSRLGHIDFSRSGFSDEEGKFHLHNVAPGEYKIFAWEDVPVGAPQDPDFRKPFEKQSVDVKMEPNGHATVELTAISVKGSQRTAQ